MLKVLLPSRLRGPEELLRRVEAIASIEELTELTLRAGAASSLDAIVDG